MPTLAPSAPNAFILGTLSKNNGLNAVDGLRGARHVTPKCVMLSHQAMAQGPFGALANPQPTEPPTPTPRHQKSVVQGKKKEID